MSQNVQSKYTCVACQEPLPLNYNNEIAKCNSCGKEYPIIKNIPILIEDQAYYFADNFFTYSTHIAAHENRIPHITQNFKLEKNRSNVAQNLKLALKQNASLVKPVTELLRPYVSPYQLVNINPSHKGNLNKYLKDFNYLRRDWCWLPEGEVQLNAINKSLTEVIEKYEINKEALLVLGAGLGRIAWDLSDLFPKVYATDKSFSMCYYYNELLAHDIVFHEIHTSNIRNNTNTTRVLKASIKEPGLKEKDLPQDKDHNKIEYFISDVTQLPLEDNAVSCSISVYFTDVLALKLYMNELRRVIKKDGLFIHFGPLGYPFEDESAMLTQEDIKSEFMKNGFLPVLDKTITTAHTSSSVSMTENTIHNWLFVAIKKEDSPNEMAKRITENSILGFKDEVFYETKGSLSNMGENVAYFNLHSTTGKVYEGAESMLDILREIDGQKNIKQVFESLSKNFDLDDELQEHITQELKSLYLDNILSIVKL